MDAMLPTWINSPRRKPSISLPGPSGSITSRVSRAAFETAGYAFGKSGGPDLLRGETMVVENAKEGQSLARKVGQRIPRLVVMVPRLSRGADDRQPLPVFPGRDGGAGDRPERHRPPTGAHVVELLLMHVAAEDVTGLT